MPVWQLDERLLFPDPQFANEDGLLAIGGDLSKDRLLLAYASGIFPWFIENEEIYWFSPDPRCVLIPGELKVSKSMQQLIKKQYFRVSYDQQFIKVIKNCKTVKRKGQQETWIDKNFIEAYAKLFEAGLAHSVEVYKNEKLVGGLYGISLGSCFFGESMFSKVSNASKYGFIFLVKALMEKKFTLIDCQVYNDHLATLGAKKMERNIFLALLEKGLQDNTITGNWNDILNLNANPVVN